MEAMTLEQIAAELRRMGYADLPAGAEISLLGYLRILSRRLDLLVHLAAIHGATAAAADIAARIGADAEETE